LGAAKEVKSLFAGDPGSYNGVFCFFASPICFPSGFFFFSSSGIIMIGRRLG
jgi:hypothetical protein